MKRKYENYFLKSKLSKIYSIFLDDLYRKGEQVIAKKLGKVLDIDFEFKYRDTSFAVEMDGKKN